MSFTGFTLEQLQATYAPAKSQELLAQLDILIDFYRMVVALLLAFGGKF